MASPTACLVMGHSRRPCAGDQTLLPTALTSGMHSFSSSPRETPAPGSPSQALPKHGNDCE